VSRRYPDARRWVVEPDDALVTRSIRACHDAHPQRRWASWARRPAPRAPVTRSGTPWPQELLASWPEHGADLLWANMSLHSQAEPEAMMRQWHALLAVDGFVMCSGLGPDTALELRAVYRAVGWPWPTVQFVDMHDLG